jgi:hypothetical protein
MQSSVYPLYRIKRLILANPSIPTSKLKARLRREKIKVSDITVSAIRRAFISDLRFLQQLGLYDAWDNPIPLRRRHRQPRYQPHLWSKPVRERHYYS